MPAHIPLIIEQHAEDAAILWLQRDRAVDAPHYNRMFLSRLDERLEANLDGLLVAGRVGWDIAREAFDRAPEPGEMFTLAALAFGAGSARGIGDVLEILAADAEGTLGRAAISALGWLPPARLRGRVQPLLDDERPAVRVLGFGACCVHRVDPGDQLARALEDTGPVATMAMKLAAVLGRSDLCRRIVAADPGPDPEARFRRAWAGVLLGDRDDALAELCRLALRPGRHQTDALIAAVLVQEAEAVRDWLGGVGPEAELLAIRASGLMGLPELVPWLIERMADAAVARHAGESFSMITGADLAFLDLDADAPDDETLNDDPADDRVELDLDAELPMPSPEAVAQWWKAEASGFASGKRYFLGQPATEATLLNGLDRGYQRQRRAAAYNLAVKLPGSPLATWRQREAKLVRWKAPAAP